MVVKTKWTNLNRFQCFRSFLQCSMRPPEEVAAQSFAILLRLAILGKARQRIQLKIEHSRRFIMLFYLCTAVLRSTNSTLQVCMEKNVKFNHDFCTNKWFFIAQKGRCALSLQIVDLKWQLLVWRLSDFFEWVFILLLHYFFWPITNVWYRSNSSQMSIFNF